MTILQTFNQNSAVIEACFTRHRRKLLLNLCLSLKSGRHIFLMKVVSFYPGMEIRKISIDQGQEQTSSLVWYLSRKRLHTGVGLLFGLGSFRNLHSNDNSVTPLCYLTVMFWECLTTLWFWMLVVVTYCSSECADRRLGTTRIIYHALGSEKIRDSIDPTNKFIFFIALLGNLAALAIVALIICAFIHMKFWLVILIIMAVGVICSIIQYIIRNLLSIYSDKTTYAAPVLVPICTVLMFVSFFQWIE